MKINIFVQRFFHRSFIIIYWLVVLNERSSAASRWSSYKASYFLIAQTIIGRYLVVMSATDCSKEEGMCSLVDAVSLRCLDLGIRSRNIKAK